MWCAYFGSLFWLISLIIALRGTSIIIGAIIISSNIKDLCFTGWNLQSLGFTTSGFMNLFLLFIYWIIYIFWKLFGRLTISTFLLFYIVSFRLIRPSWLFLIFLGLRSLSRWLRSMRYIFTFWNMAFGNKRSKSALAILTLYVLIHNWIW